MILSTRAWLAGRADPCVFEAGPWVFGITEMERRRVFPG
jgi:hypothetical protein